MLISTTWGAATLSGGRLDMRIGNRLESGNGLETVWLNKRLSLCAERSADGTAESVPWASIVTPICFFDSTHVPASLHPDIPPR
ncbi:hypothetical protein IG631_05791 [Alternaria alternata]|jgi:hypothetical protein|nr:hypothetical protein IG631_05791 [Alternaria alternata]